MNGCPDRLFFPWQMKLGLHRNFFLKESGHDWRPTTIKHRSDFRSLHAGYLGNFASAF